MDIKLRLINDAATLVEWRREVIDAMSMCEPDGELLDANREYYERHLADGTHYAVIASVDGEDAGCGAVCFHEEPPSTENPSGRCGYLTDIYVREQYRLKGTGEAIANHLIEQCRKRNCGKIYLETTAEGRELCENLGFSEMRDMMDL